MEDDDFQRSTSASRDVGQWLSSLPSLKHLSMDNVRLKDEFYSEAADRAKHFKVIYEMGLRIPAI